MSDLPPLADIAHVIQLAVAPVFLITGIGSMLGVLSGRIARIIDRARVLEAQLVGLPATQVRHRQRALQRLAARARLIYTAISLCVVAALMVVSMVAMLFIDVLARLDLSAWIAMAFVGALLALIAGLLCFLREVYLATRYLRIGEPEGDNPTEG